MSRGMRRPAGVTVAALAWFAVAGCTPPPAPLLVSRPRSSVPQGQDSRGLAADLSQLMPGADVLSAPPGTDTCGRDGVPVVRGAMPERVLFASGSDEPAFAGGEALDLLADQVRRDAPGADVTVLGHTDAVGSDTYNLDLSRRRALRVLRALAVRGLDPGHLSAVAIGKRQPIADNATAEGRARNRRVEFLISGCLAANLGVVRAQASSAGDSNAPVDVVRLDPSSAYGLATIGRISLRQPRGEERVPAVAGPVEQPAAVKPPIGLARPAPAPHYQPKPLSPGAQPNSLGPAVPF